MNLKTIVIKIFKFLILTLNKFLRIFKLIIVPIHYYTPLTELKNIPNHKLLEKADFSKINYDQSKSLLFLNSLEKHIKYFSKLDQFNSGQSNKYGKGYGYAAYNPYTTYEYYQPNQNDKDSFEEDRIISSVINDKDSFEEDKTIISVFNIKFIELKKAIRKIITWLDN